MLSAWRIIKEKYQSYPLDGEGARKTGGRWNHMGVPTVYASESLSLAALEVFVHLGVVFKGISFVSVEIMIPEKTEITEIALSEMKKIQRQEKFRDYGTDWLNSLSSVALKVPSIIIPSEQNILINPMHPDVKKLKVKTIQKFNFDERLWKSL